jgi:mycothiol synthase
MRHPELYIRPLEADDLDRVTTLLDECLDLDEVTRDWVKQKTFDDPDYDGELTLVALDGGDMVAFAQGIVRPPAESGHIKWFATKAEYRGKGVATNLLDRIEDAMKRQGVKTVGVATSAPNYTWSGFDPRYTAAASFLIRRGYERDGGNFDMTCDLSQSDWDTSVEEATAAEQGITFRQPERDDLQRVLDFFREHFNGWIPEAAAAFRNTPVTMHIAEKDNRIIGFAAYDTNNIGRGWFGPMGTDPNIRGKGIGRVTLLRCLRDQKAQGNAESVIPWVGPLGFYYGHCRAQVSRVFWTMNKTLGE